MIRLLVAATLALAMQEAPGPTQSEPASWEVERVVDPMTDKVEHRLSIHEGPRGVSISCVAGQYSVYYVDLQGLGAYPPETALTYRIDDGTPVSGIWRYSRDAATARGADVQAFLANLRSGARLRVRAASILRGYSDADIDISGASEALDALAGRCLPAQP